MKLFKLILLVTFVLIFQKLVIAQENIETKSDPNIPIFEIKNDLGQTVFAVYPGGVHIFINDQLKATGGGFKVGRISTEKATQGDILTVDPGEVNVFIDNPLKATGGGFKVGRISTEKANGESDNYLTVTPDSTRVYVSESSNKGFAVGKLGATKNTDFLNLTPENYFIGHLSGAKTTGLYNLFLGYESGFSNTNGYSNTFLGYKSGYSNTSGYNNVFIGNHAGYFNLDGFKNVFIGDSAGYNNIGPSTNGWEGKSNVYIGDNAGKMNTYGYHNVFIGKYAGLNNTTGANAVFIGHEAGKENTSGFRNVYVGLSSGRDNTTGGSNTYVGMLTGVFNQTGGYNVFLGDGSGFTSTGGSNVYLGFSSGSNNTEGSGNVYIGSQAGRYETGSNNLFIDNSSTSTPLIWGDFSADRLAFNGNVGVNRNAYPNVSLSVSPNSLAYGLYVDAGSTSYAGYFNGNIHATGTVTSSDVRWKRNIKEILNPLDKILSLRGVTYEWNTEKYSENGFSEEIQIGVIAQEVEKVFPELVKENEDGYKAVFYDKLAAVLIEAIKEQQEEIDQLKKADDEVAKLKKENSLLKVKLSEIDKLKIEIESLKEILKKMNKTNN